MSNEEILTNVNYFFTSVLVDAHISGKWTTDSVDAAFSWACYCEEIYKSSCGVLESTPLVEQIEGIVAQVEHTEQASVAFLKNSSKYLLQAFFQNDNLSDDILQHVFIKGYEKGHDAKKVVAQVTEMKLLCIDVIQKLDSLQLPAEAASLSQEIEAECLLEYLGDKLSLYSNKNETESLLDEFAVHLFEDTQKMTKFVHLILAEVEKESAELAVLQKILAKKLIQKVFYNSTEFSRNVACNLWSLKTSLLCRAASKYSDFYKCYVHMLATSVSLMKLSREKGLICWELRNSPAGPDFTVDELVHHFQSLISADAKIGELTKSLLLSHSSDVREPDAWAEILYQVMR